MIEGFELVFARGLWGLPEASFAEQSEMVIEDGFQWVEAYWDGPNPEMISAFHSSQLKWIAQIHTRRVWENDGEPRFRRMVGEAIDHGAQMINVHSGSDAESPETNTRVLDLAADLSTEFGIPIVHETHRSRATFSARDTMQLILLRPDTRFCADLSHWTCVHEALLENWSAEVEATLERTLLIHARVGFTQGPQLPDWRSPYFQTELEVFLSWWDIAVRFAKEQDRRLVLCPEFGPIPYQAISPTSGEVLADR